jgi:hypothetical protein
VGQEMTGMVRQNASTEQAMRHCEALMGRLRSAADRGNHEEAEHVSKLLSEHLISARLPCDYQRETLAAARHLHMKAAMKATDLALDRAFSRALAKQTLEHARELSRARDCLGKAALLGAPREFRQACEGRIRTIVQSTCRSAATPAARFGAHATA